MAEPGVFVVERDSKPDRFGRVSFTATWVTAEGHSRGQRFFMHPDDFTERAALNGYEVVGFDVPPPFTLEALHEPRTISQHVDSCATEEVA